MLDPIFDAVKRFLAYLAAIPRRILGYVKVPPKTTAEGQPQRFRFLKWSWHLMVASVVLLGLIYILPFFWVTAAISGWDIAYPASVLVKTEMVSADEQVSPAGAATDAKTCDRSQTVAMMAYLIDFDVNQNTWVPALPQSKFGFFGLPWEATPWFDNKAAFQHGTLVALRRMAVELTDQIGRVRGTSEADPDLAAARGLLQTDDELWWFNPLSDRLPFGPVTPAPSIYRDAMSAYDRFNARLEDCGALYDTRADNLRQMIDRISNDVGSVVDALSKRSNSRIYDTRSRMFVDGTGNDRAWLDFYADNRFNHASGMMYAYHGLLQAVREDFSDVIKARGVADIWDRMEAHVAEAANLDPLIVSNGREDGFLFPDHLAAMSQRMLRARANMTEVADVLDR